MKNNKKIFVFIPIIFFLCIICILIIIFPFQYEKKCAHIYVDNKLYDTINLSDTDINKKISIETVNGYNIVEISNGMICISEADCPDKTCVNTGWINSSAKPIICIPHKVEIIIESFDQIDGVT